MALIKECRSRGIDYKPAGKDIEAIKQLLVADDNKSGGAANESTAPTPAAEAKSVEPAPSTSAADEPTAKTSKKKKKKAKLQVGDAVNVEEFDCTGIIRFVGPHHETGKNRIGVELAEPLAKSGGKFKVWVVHTVLLILGAREKGAGCGHVCLSIAPPPRCCSMPCSLSATMPSHVSLTCCA